MSTKEHLITKVSEITFCPVLSNVDHRYHKIRHEVIMMKEPAYTKG